MCLFYFFFSRDVLQSLTSTDLSNESFPFSTHQVNALILLRVRQTGAPPEITSRSTDSGRQGCVCLVKDSIICVCTCSVYKVISETKKSYGDRAQMPPTRPLRYLTYSICQKPDNVSVKCTVWCDPLLKSEIFWNGTIRTERKRHLSNCMLLYHHEKVDDGLS